MENPLLLEILNKLNVMTGTNKVEESEEREQNRQRTWANLEKMKLRKHLKSLQK